MQSPRNYNPQAENQWWGISEPTLSFIECVKIFYTDNDINKLLWHNMCMRTLLQDVKRDESVPSPVVSAFGHQLPHHLSTLSLAKYSTVKTLQLGYALSLLSDTVFLK